MENLKELNLGHTAVTGAGLAALRDLPRLERIEFHGTPLNDEGFAHLGAITSLRKLHTIKGDISDAGIESLAGLENLESLSVTSTTNRITDASLETFKNMKSLRYLGLQSKGISNAGRAALNDLRESWKN